jgi:hypothetical protein
MTLLKKTNCYHKRLSSYLSTDHLVSEELKIQWCKYLWINVKTCWRMLSKYCSKGPTIFIGEPGHKIGQRGRQYMLVNQDTKLVNQAPKLVNASQSFLDISLSYFYQRYYYNYIKLVQNIEQWSCTVIIKHLNVCDIHKAGHLLEHKLKVIIVG